MLGSTAVRHAEASDDEAAIAVVEDVFMDLDALDVSMRCWGSFFFVDDDVVDGFVVSR